MKRYAREAPANQRAKHRPTDAREEVVHGEACVMKLTQ